MKPRIYSGAKPDAIAEDLRPLCDFGEDGMSLEELKGLIEERLVPHLSNYGLPSFHSFFNSPPEAGAELGGVVALRHNQGVTNWQVSPGGAVLEELCGRALGRLFGFPETADATFLYSGTYANQQTLYMALHRRAEEEGFDFAAKGLSGFREPERLVVAVSEQAHFSVRHAVRMLGLGEKSLLRVPVDGRQRMDVAALQDVLSNRATRDHVCAVVATTGTTSTGAVDQAGAVIDACAGTRAWVHVDGAYGLAYTLVPEWAPLFAGFERADSVSWDPHKQLGVPIPNSVLFAKRGADFKRMAIYGEYFNREDDPYPNPGLKSAPSTRPMSALALAASLRHQGMAKVRERLRAPLEAVKAFAEKLAGAPDVELCHAPDTGILCLRLVPKGTPTERLDALQLHIFRRFQESGERSVAITRVGGRAALRFVAVSPAVTTDALLESLEAARAAAKDL
ncbi:MAG: aspartate aminotransferase family protein [Candidatus Aminicenantes bacterium]|nr:aspartate aminotransferase family protein [Candidatus Aminicenantes bacterium]